MTTHVSRRGFLKGMSAEAAISRFGAGFSFADQTTSASREKLFVFSYADIKLTGGPLDRNAFSRRPYHDHAI
jgi:hypothetical protein